MSAYHVTPYIAWRFEESTARQTLLDHFNAASLAGFGCEDKPFAVRAAGGLLQYLQEAQKDGLAQIIGLRTYSTAEFMTLDEATRRNLELTESIRGGTVQGSLLGVLDATLTPMGGREIRRRLSQPLLDVTALNRRLDALTAWHDDAPARAELRQTLRGLGDLERWTNRCVQGIALPRDLVGIREALARAERIRDQGSGSQGSGAGVRSQESETRVTLPRSSASRVTEHASRITHHASRLDPCADIASLLATAITDEPPATLANSGIIRPGFSAELDGIHLATRDAKSWIANLESVERARTGIRSLKVGYNKVFGYYIEVTTANAALDPDRLYPQANAGQCRAVHHAGPQGIRVAGAQCRGAHPGTRGAALPATAGPDRGGRAPAAGNRRGHRRAGRRGRAGRGRRGEPLRAAPPGR